MIVLLILFASGRLVVAQSATDLVSIKGLSPVAILAKTAEGRAALAANYSITGEIQAGTSRQKTLLPFPEEQQQALRDAFITSGNLVQLSDGLGTTLEAAYTARAHYLDRRNFTSMSMELANVISYAVKTSGMNARRCKYFFANETIDGKLPASANAISIISEIGGQPDVFGSFYGLPAGQSHADAYGNSRPFQTEKRTTQIVGLDYFDVLASNIAYNQGPLADLIDSPSFPSGHTTYGFIGSILMAILVPTRYQEMIVRGAEYGNNRIIMGSHYAMDVIGGRTLALYDMAHLLAGDHAYVEQMPKGASLARKFRDTLDHVRGTVTSVLQVGCGGKVATCAHQDIGRFSNPASNGDFYESTQTYGLPVVYASRVGTAEDVANLAPEAGYLLTAAFPFLTLEQADRLLTETEGPGGGFLDDGSAFGVYSRLDLYAAADKVVKAIPR